MRAPGLLKNQGGEGLISATLCGPSDRCLLLLLICSDELLARVFLCFAKRRLFLRSNACPFEKDSET